MWRKIKKFGNEISYYPLFALGYVFLLLAQPIFRLQEWRDRKRNAEWEKWREAILDQCGERIRKEAQRRLLIDLLASIIENSSTPPTGLEEFRGQIFEEFARIDPIEIRCVWRQEFVKHHPGQVIKWFEEKIAPLRPEFQFLLKHEVF